MTIKSFYTLLLSATTLILASCSTEVTDEQSAAVGSTTRSFIVKEVQAPVTRTNVVLVNQSRGMQEIALWLIILLRLRRIMIIYL